MRDLREFIPFSAIEDKECIVVDALHPHATILSHWRGANFHPSIEADTSGEIVLNALQNDFSGLNKQWVSANHFDIDGFVGVFALLYPELAKQYDAVLREMGIIGDFREYKPMDKNSQYALKLCCWMNQVESNKFYRPFGEKEEMKLCVQKFEYFLEVFPKVLQNPESFADNWKVEVEKVENDISILRKGNRTFYPGLTLLVQELSEPIHYYAAFSESYGFDYVLSCFDKHKYELECKYTTWVDITSRSSFPRLNLKPLAVALNQIEKSDYQWEVDKVTDTGPILRLESNSLSKADRFDQPYRRDIYSSSISKEVFQEKVLNYLKNAFQHTEQKRFWTWDEIREFNKK